MISKIIKFIKDASAVKESDSKRDGFISYHAESHSAGVGIGAGFFFGMTGNMELLGVVMAAVVAGLRGAQTGAKSKILTDIKQEPHYCLGGVVVGVLVGIGVSGFL